MMAWFGHNAILFVLSIATLQTVMHADQLNRESDPGVHLAYDCENVPSPSEDGIPIIMLHGMSDIKETWNLIYKNISLLTRRKVCVYDARNHGDSSWSDTFGIDDLAEDLENFMRARGIEKAALVGHSMGGLTAMKFALKNPDKVESLFVEDVSPFLRIPKDVVTSFVQFVRLLKKSLEAVPGDADEDTVTNAVIDYITKATNQPPLPYLFIKFPFKRRNGMWQWKANFDVFVKILGDVDSWVGKMEGRYDGEVFFIYGTASDVFNIDDEEAIRKLFPKAEFFAVEGAGHEIHSHHPEFLDQLIAFLKLKDERNEL